MPESASASGRVEWMTWFWLLVALLIVVYPGLNPDSASTRTFFIIFASILLEAIPFMLLGTLVGGLIEVFLTHDRMTSLLPANKFHAICTASALGLIFPVCECAVVPVVRRLIGKGLPAAAAIAYLLGGPIVNPVVFVSTGLAYRFNWQVAASRAVWGYLTAVVVAFLAGRILGDGGIVEPGGPVPPSSDSGDGGDCGHHHHHHHPAPARGMVRKTSLILEGIRAAVRHAQDDFMATAPFLVAGSFIAALAQTHVERAAFVALSSSPLLSNLAMMALAVLLNLCSEADAFIAASFTGYVPLAAQMAFMLIGPMFDLKLLLMYRGIFRRRAIFLLATLIPATVFAASLLIHLLVRAN
ncbi:MAG: permease [Planctomycetota bacterium]|jgi:uncharacterized membrane protein YraQ (UPF0718 family)|nr:permease [Planctomycetota bacterium]